MNNGTQILWKTGLVSPFLSEISDHFLLDPKLRKTGILNTLNLAIKHSKEDKDILKGPRVPRIDNLVIKTRTAIWIPSSKSGTVTLSKVSSLQQASYIQIFCQVVYILQVQQHKQNSWNSQIVFGFGMPTQGFQSTGPFCKSILWMLLYCEWPCIRITTIFCCIHCFSLTDSI